MKRLLVMFALVFVLCTTALAQSTSTESLAYNKIFDLSRPIPTLAQCHANIISWRQEWKDHDKRMREVEHQLLSPPEHLSVEELYRRKDEASSCQFVKNASELDVSYMQLRLMQSMMKLES